MGIFKERVQNLLNEERSRYLAYVNNETHPFKEYNLVRAHRTLLIAAIRKEIKNVGFIHHLTFNSFNGGLSVFFNRNNEQGNHVYVSWDMTEPMLIRFRYKQTTFLHNMENNTAIADLVREISTYIDTNTP